MISIYGVSIVLYFYLCMLHIFTKSLHLFKVRREVIVETDNKSNKKRKKVTLDIADTTIETADNHNENSCPDITTEETYNPCSTSPNVISTTGTDLTEKVNQLEDQPPWFKDQATTITNKQTNCCSHKSQLHNSKRCNKRLKKKVSELNEVVKELKKVSNGRDHC